MLEFNLDGKLNNTFDAGNAYQRVAGSEASSYGLGQTNDPLAPASLNPLTEDTLISPWEDAGQASNAQGIKRNGALPQGHNAQATEFGINPASNSGDHNDNEALAGTAQQGQGLAQRLSDTAPIDQLTGGHQDGRAISSPQQAARAASLQLDQANPADLNTAPREFDPLTGDMEEASFGFIPMLDVTVLNPDVISYNGERAEVNNLLAEERFDRDQPTGTETHYNFTYGSGDSANEGSGYDITDSLNNAADIGTVAYRDDKQVIGSIGYSSGRSRDSNDYFSFYAGKDGQFDLSLTGLSANVGLALYDQNGSLMSWSNKSGTQSENISTNLNQGWYTSRIYSYNSGLSNNGGATGFSLNISRQADCFEQLANNLIDDSSVKNAVLNSIKHDDSFDRDDTIGILKSAGDYGSVTSTELTDLRQFWNTFSNTMRADIAGLSKKVVFADDSNAWYTGFDSIRDQLGNLKAGTSTQDLNLLIGKHMLGTDRPEIHRDSNGTLQGSYTQANGSLFINGVSFDDVGQGSMGTCYLLAGLAGTANDKANLIHDMFTDNGDGTWSVRFITNGQADYVTVDNMMATRSNGTYLYANAGGDNGARNSVAGNNELWVALAEKAYAQINESGRIDQDGSNSYEGINGGFSDLATEHITGLETKRGRAIHSWLTWFGVSDSELQTLVNGNNIVTTGGFNNNASTDDDDDGSIDWKSTTSTNIGRAVQGHAYSIVGYDATTGRYDIRNPWDQANLSLTHAQLRELGASIRYSVT